VRQVRPVELHEAGITRDVGDEEEPALDRHAASILHPEPPSTGAGVRRQPEVGGTDARVLTELLARPRDDDATRLEHVAAAREPERPARVLLDEQDGHARRVDPLDGSEDLAREHRRQAERGLVEHEQARPGHERPGGRQALLHGAVARPRGRLTSPEIVLIVVDLPLPFAPRSATISPRPTVSETPSTARRLP